MEKLIIGREKGVDVNKARLGVTLEDGTFIPFSKVSNRFSGVSRNHLEVIIGDDNKMTVRNLQIGEPGNPDKPGNVTYVDGRLVGTKSGLPLSARIELGPDKVPVDVQTILRHISGKQFYSIGHLEAVYEANRAADEMIRKRQTMINLASSVPSILTYLSIFLVLLLDDGIGKIIRVALVGVAIVVTVVLVIVRYKRSVSLAEEKRILAEKYRSEFVCPNPACGFYLGDSYKSYKEVLNHATCPHCHANFKP